MRPVLGLTRRDFVSVIDDLKQYFRGCEGPEEEEEIFKKLAEAVEDSYDSFGLDVWKSGSGQNTSSSRYSIFPYDSWTKWMCARVEQPAEELSGINPAPCQGEFSAQVWEDFLSGQPWKDTLLSNVRARLD